MAILKISNSLKESIANIMGIHIDLNQNDIDILTHKSDEFTQIFNNTKKLLDSDHFVIIKNINLTERKDFFESFVKMFGTYYGAIEHTDIKIDCKYTGCSLSPILLHNDDAVDLQTQPIYGFIQVIKEDSSLNVSNGIVKMDELINYLSTHNENFLKQLYEIKIPMLSYGVNYEGNDKTEIITNEPILYKYEDDTRVRFDLSRVEHYYWKKGIVQAKEEKMLIHKFFQYCEKLKKNYILEKGDILIHNNKKCLHDRSECSVEICKDGTTSTREIFVSFTKEGNK